MSDPQDYWGDTFEDTVAAALIACFESRVKKNRGAAPSDRLTPERIGVLQRIGPYIPSNSRHFEVRDNSKFGVFDTTNDPLPVSGCFAINPSGKVQEDWPNCYLMVIYFHRALALGKYWHKREPGVLYESFELAALPTAIDGQRSFFTVSKGGVVAACEQRIASVQGYLPGVRQTTIGPDDVWLHTHSFWMSMALQAIADARHCWMIEAQEHVAHARLGCMQEEIKSLLYARTLPLTATGRKRPVLHLVEAHHRRMKSGIDIDVTAFLRGTQTVDIGSTRFTVRPPAALHPHVTVNSQRQYFNERLGI